MDTVAFVKDRGWPGTDKKTGLHQAAPTVTNQQETSRA